MRHFCALLLVALGLAGVAAAAGPALTIPQLQAQTKTVLNRRLVFAHATMLIRSVRCQRDTPTAFFCVAKTAWVASGTPAPPLMWNVTVDAHDIIHWQIAR